MINPVPPTPSRLSFRDKRCQWGKAGGAGSLFGKALFFPEKSLDKEFFIWVCSCFKNKTKQNKTAEPEFMGLFFPSPPHSLFLLFLLFARMFPPFSWWFSPEKRRSERRSRRIGKTEVKIVATTGVPKARKGRSYPAPQETPGNHPAWINSSFQAPPRTLSP